MSVRIMITPVLRRYTDNRKWIDVEGMTIRDCLQRLVSLYPDTEKWIFGNNSAPMIGMFLNKTVVLPGNLDMAVADGDVIDLFPVIGGG